MAEMLIDGTKLDACNTAEADAIRAKTGGTDPIPYDYANNKGFADAIAAIQTGGGLPQGMTHIGSGAFTFASRTVLNTAINHGLSFTPRAVIIWTNVEPSAAEMFYCLLMRQLANNTGTIKSERFLAIKASNATGIETTQYSSTDADFFITSTTFNIGHGSRYYSAGATYNWLAFD